MNERHALFVAEYLLDLNATQAAIRVGFSEKTAYSQGQRLLKNVEVAAAIKEALDKRSERTQVDADWVLKRLDLEASADLADLYTEAGDLKPIHQWPLIWRQGLVAGIEAVEERDDRGNVVGTVRKVKLSDRIKRIELLGKHVGVQAFKDRVEHSGELNLVVTNEDAGL